MGLDARRRQLRGRHPGSRPSGVPGRRTRRPDLPADGRRRGARDRVPAHRPPRSRAPPPFQRPTHRRRARRLRHPEGQPDDLVAERPRRACPVPPPAADQRRREPERARSARSPRRVTRDHTRRNLGWRLGDARRWIRRPIATGRRTRVRRCDHRPPSDGAGRSFEPRVAPVERALRSPPRRSRRSPVRGLARAARGSPHRSRRGRGRRPRERPRRGARGPRVVPTTRVVGEVCSRMPPPDSGGSRA